MITTSLVLIMNLVHSIVLVFQMLPQIVRIPLQVHRQRTRKRIRLGIIIDHHPLPVPKPQNQLIVRDTSIFQLLLCHLSETLRPRSRQYNLCPSLLMQLPQMSNIVFQRRLCPPSRNEVLSRVLDQRTVDIAEQRFESSRVAQPCGEGTPVFIAADRNGDEGLGGGEHL